MLIHFSNIPFAHFAYRQDLKLQLTRERETVRHITLQRDIDMKDLQSRLDKTVRRRAHAESAL